jgi:hypothetical protein
MGGSVNSIARIPEDIFIGQKAIVNREVGTVTDFRTDFPHEYIAVKLISKGYACNFSPDNVKLLTPLPKDYLRGTLRTLQAASQFIGTADSFKAPEVIAQLEAAILQTREMLYE